MLQATKFKTIVKKVLKGSPLVHATDETTFGELNIQADVTRGLSEIGINKPSEYQAVVLPQILGHDEDIYLLSNSGAGKTMLAAIIMLNHIDPTKNFPQVLCLLPNKEMAEQTTSLVSRIGSYKGVRAWTIGADHFVGKFTVDYNCSSEQSLCIILLCLKNKYIYFLDQTSHILLAAPREALNAKQFIQFPQITLTVIDEADVVTTTRAVKNELMSPLRHSKKLLTSNIVNKATEFLTNFKVVRYDVPMNILHSYIPCYDVAKSAAVVNLCRTLQIISPIAQCIVFCRVSSDFVTVILSLTYEHL